MTEKDRAISTIFAIWMMTPLLWVLLTVLIGGDIQRMIFALIVGGINTVFVLSVFKLMK